MKSVIVIPARLESRRLPRKLLLAETGKPLIQHTWEQACKAGMRVIIATDSEEIYEVSRTFGAQVLGTNHSCRNGTERVAEVAEKLDDVDIFVDWQADWPEVDPRDVKLLGGLWKSWELPELDVVSMAYRTVDLEEANRGDVTKVVTPNYGSHAMYFSRSRIPSHLCGPWWIHVGVYGFTRRGIEFISGLKPRKLEIAENLEQLRWMEYGVEIEIMACDRTAIHGIDTREDYDAFVARQLVREVHKAEN